MTMISEHNTMDSVLRNFPPASVNNARSIIKNLLAKFKEYPSAYWAKQLEEVGVDVDFNNLDNGN